MNEESNFKMYMSLLIENMNSINKVINYEECLRVAHEIDETQKLNGRIHFTGVGKCSYVAKYGASLFSSLGTPSYFLDATEAIHGSNGQVKEKDLVISISNSGETEEMINCLKALNEIGIKFVSITGNKESSISKMSYLHCELKNKFEGGPLNKAPRISVVKQVILIQAISIIVQSFNNISISQYKKWHPGGSLGKSIKD